MPRLEPTGPHTVLPVSKDPAKPALSIRGLRFTYPGAAAPTLDIASFDLAAGGQALLTGGSGSGKSTLLHLIAGLEEPTSGEIKVAGRNMHKLAGPQRDAFRGATVGMVFQTHHLLLGFSALENVMLAMTFSSIPKTEHKDRAAELLKTLGIERTAATPESLSIGQQQRVAVARALVTGPALVLADEPTASLDPGAAATSMDLMQQACKDRGAALLCVSHDPAMNERFEITEDLAALQSAPA